MDVLKMINDLKTRLWDEYGDVLRQPYTQDEIHLTYYAGAVLERAGHSHHVFNGETYYTEKAMHMAFIAGHRAGLAGVESRAEEIAKERLSAAKAALEGIE